MTAAGRISTVALIAGAAAALMVVAAGPAYRLNLLGLGGAFSLLRWGAWLGVAALLVALGGLWLSRRHGSVRGAAYAITGLVLGALAFGVPFAMLQAAKGSPPIHDITTDTANPPQFVAVVPLRSGARNPVAYEGEAIARQQRAAYPDVQPALLDVPPDRAYQRALDVAHRLHWDVHASVPAEGRIEATDTTPWFGFKDDIVVRITPTASGSRVDVRSVSRLGTGDLGTNARRVRAFLRDLAS
jgi:uncharacterized protein (DUF1499 family)